MDIKEYELVPSGTGDINIQLVEAQKQRAEAEKAANKKYWDEFKSNN